MYGLLDQGWWPDGLYTAPTDEALKYDIEKTKELGFNMIRKHVKIEPARWYYHCDQLGILVWQDMPNGGTVTTQQNEKKIISGNGRDNESVRKNYYNTLDSMVKNLYNHPCIVVWVPFNEAWGQFETSKVTDVIRKLDSTRLIESTSGWFDQKCGDIRSYHDYPGPKMPKLEKNRAVALTEFGGLGLVIKNHLWVEKKSWGYRNLKTKKILMDTYKQITEKLPDLIKKGLCAAIYTQTTDVESEVNGFMTYDRKVLKLDAEKLKKIHFTLVNSL
jgi:beta-galactosidase/beta-glucuronidase